MIANHAQLIEAHRLREQNEALQQENQNLHASLEVCRTDLRDAAQSLQQLEVERARAATELQRSQSRVRRTQKLSCTLTYG